MVFIENTIYNIRFLTGHVDTQKTEVYFLYIAFRTPKRQMIMMCLILLCRYVTFTHRGGRTFSKVGVGAKQKKHMLTHSVEKQFNCKECDFRSAWAANLKRHMLTHGDGDMMLFKMLFTTKPQLLTQMITTLYPLRRR